MKSKLASISASFERLSGREQLMTLGVGAGATLLILGLSTWIITKDLNMRDKRINAKQEQLVELMGLQQDYQRRLGEQNRLADEIRKNNDVRLLSYIEQVSKTSKTEIKNAAERAGAQTGSDLLKEEDAEVSVQNVSLDRLYDFLKKLEEGNRLVKVRRLEIRTRFDNAQMLDAKVTVGTYKTTES